MSRGQRLYLVASGHAHPDRELTSAELERRIPGLRDGWCDKYLGIRSRRVLGIDERVTDLTLAALGDALDEAGWGGDDLDAILCGNVFPDQVVPAAASYLAQVHNPTAIAFDVAAACSSFIYALSVAGGLTDGDRIRRVAVCSGEHPSAYVDYTDSYSCVFFGDSAGVVLVTTERPDGGCFEVVDIALNGNHEHPEKVFTPRVGSFRSDGRFSFTVVTGLAAAAGRELLERHGVDPATIAGSVMHQASIRVLEELETTLGVPVDRQWHNLVWAGNQSAAGVVTAFSAGWKAHRDELRDGDHVLLTVGGGGYTGAAALLRWTA